NAVESGMMLTLSVGNTQGSPAMASFGTGNVGTTGTLMRDNMTTDNMGCTWHQKDVSMFTLIGGDIFTLQVTETEEMFAGTCTPFTSTSTCTTVFTATFSKAATGG